MKHALCAHVFCARVGSRVAEYGEVPEVLVSLAEQFHAFDGAGKEGIFRVAASKARATAAKAAIDGHGSYAECDSAHTVANLMKQWFRELPTPFFQVVSEAEIGAAMAAGVGLDRLLRVLSYVSVTPRNRHDVTC